MIAEAVMLPLFLKICSTSSVLDALNRVLWINCTLSTLYSNSDGNGYKLEDMTQFFVSIIYQLSLNNNGSIQLVFGLNYYVNQFVVDDKKKQFSFQAVLTFAPKNY